MPDTISATAALFAVLWLIFAAFALVAVVQRWRGNIVLGLDVRRGAMRGLLTGFGIGALAMTGVFVVEWALGLLSIVDVQLAFVPFLQACGLLLGYALYEEVMFRVLMLNGILVVVPRDGLPWR